MRSRLDWIRAGQELLREGGFRAVKLRSLGALLGVTTGSFYHHFEGFDAFLGELAAQYASDSARLEQALAGQDAVQRIRTMLSIRRAADLPPLDRAMRVWAATDERAAAAVRRLDHAALKLIEDAFLELGFGVGEARMRAHTAYAAGIGLGMTSAPWRATRDGEQRAVRLFVGDPPGPHSRTRG